MNNIEFKDRLQQAMSKRNIKAVELSEKTKLSKSAISQYLSGYSIPKTDRTYIIAKALGIDPAWLIGYDVDMNMQASLQPFDIFKFPDIMPTPKTKKVPRLGTIACGLPILAEANIETYDSVDESLHCDFTLLCKGDSMLPKLQENDVVLIHSQPDVENGQIAAVLIGDEATLKKVHKSENGLILTAENTVYPPMLYTGEQLENISIIGKVVGIIRYF